MSQMVVYHDLLRNIFLEGNDVYNKRTNTICRTLTGESIKFDLRKSFPVLTTRKAPFKSGVGELLGFFRGYTNAEDFAKLGCKFWYGNANETQSWLNNPFRQGENDLGDIYSKIWTDTEVFKVLPVEENKEKLYYLFKKGYHIFSQDRKEIILKKNVNQLETVVRKILSDPTDRRIILNGWDLSYEETQALPVCHMTYQFIPCINDNTLDVVMYMRSSDAFLGLPNNIVTTSLLLSIVARLTGYTAAQVTIMIGNVHLYKNSFEATKELLARDHFPDPVVTLSENIKKIEAPEEIKGCFERIQPEDIQLEGYQSHPAISVAMVA